MSPDSQEVAVFAVVGHPNEGKSSVVATLSENDKIRISPRPGETLVSTPYSVRLDGQEMLRFIDTPGFQNPRRALAWFEAYDGPENQVLRAFIDAHHSDPAFAHEIELLQPLAAGAGIIYVVDGTRPLRSEDRAEMEILRRSGLPRLAIINRKADGQDFSEDWKQAFMRHFNAVRPFNAVQATYRERMGLLDTLKSIDPDWTPILEKVIRSLEADWQRRSDEAVDLLTRYFTILLSYEERSRLNRDQDPTELTTELENKYRDALRGEERKLFSRLKALYRHNVFDFQPEEHPLLQQDLFSRETWELLGLDRNQLTWLAGLAGAGGGAAIDVAAAGLTFGIFTAAGAAAGALTARYGGKELAGRKWGELRLPGLRIPLRLGRQDCHVGPHPDPQFPFILIDRALLYYQHVINWAHARQPGMETTAGLQELPRSATWPGEERAQVARFARAIQRGRGDENEAAFRALVQAKLEACWQG